MRAASVAWALLVAGCGGPPQIVSLVRAPGLPAASPANSLSPLEVSTRSTAVADPLPVRGSHIVLGDLESALGSAVVSAVTPWAEAHRGEPVARRGGWSVLVELTAADAQLEQGGRVLVGLDVRATLRTRRGNVYLGQTQLGCREGGLMDAERAAPVAYRCMLRVGRDLAGWLSGGVPLDPPDDPVADERR